MKTAKQVVSSVELQCPHCSQAIPAPGGSLFWAVAELPVAGARLTCTDCGQQSKTPKVKA